jgi:hypothetical protein
VNNNIYIETEDNQQRVWSRIEHFAFVSDDKDRDQVIFELERLEGSIFIEVDSIEEKIILVTIEILKMMSEEEFYNNCQTYSRRTSQGEINSEYLNGIS